MTVRAEAGGEEEQEDVVEVGAEEEVVEGMEDRTKTVLPMTDQGAATKPATA